MVIIDKWKMFKEFNKIPTRLNIGIMLFFACALSYMMRVNVTINLLAMVKDTSMSGGNTNITGIAIEKEKDYGPRYDWDANQQALILGSYFIGYLTTSLPAGVIAEYFGPTIVVGLTSGLSAIITALSSLSASLGFAVFYTNRFVLGALGGVLYPCLHNLISKWSPPSEKGKFVAALLGNTFGTVITLPLAGLLIESLGWSYAYYIPALICMIITIIWMYLVADTPAKHKRILPEEKEYIETSLGTTVAKKIPFPPYIKIFTSVPFYALLILHFGNLWGLYFCINAAPKYMKEILGFNLSKTGFTAALPHLSRLVLGFVFGSIGDYYRKTGKLSVTFIRKSFCIFSHIIPGILLVALGFVTNPYVCVMFIALSLGFNGASTMTNLQNSQDLAPNFAGSLYGIINFVGSTTGFITPLVVSYFTSEENTVEQWRKIYLIAAFAYIVPAILFIIFGTGLVQSWNDLPQKKEETAPA